jgi:hypothetical protein
VPTPQVTLQADHPVACHTAAAVGATVIGGGQAFVDGTATIVAQTQRFPPLSCTTIDLPMIELIPFSGKLKSVIAMLTLLLDRTPNLPLRSPTSHSTGLAGLHEVVETLVGL